jgi:MoaA/NifB/PqqE/SkfB family radical SAM enzyme
VLDTIAPYVQRIKLTGGEPTCHPQFADIIAALHQRTIPFTLFSNGSWQHPESIIALLRQVPNCLGILVSLHGADAPTHEHFTGVAGSFANVVETIQRVVQAGIVVHTNTVIGRYNAQQLEAVATFSQQLGAACSVYNRYIGAALPGFDLTNGELRQVAEELNRLTTAGYSIKIGTPLLPHHHTTPYPCSAGTAYGTIDPWGYVRPCNHAPLIAGNILHDKLEVLWQNEAMHTWRILATESVGGAGEAAHGCAIGNAACRADMLLRKK